MSENCAVCDVNYAHHIRSDHGFVNRARNCRLDNKHTGPCQYDDGLTNVEADTDPRLFSEPLRIRIRGVFGLRRQSVKP